LSKGVYWMSKRQCSDWSTTHYGCEDMLGLYTAVGPRHWSCLTAPTHYVNSHESGLETQNTAISGHSSQHRMSGPLSSVSWKFYGDSSPEPCGCQKGILLLCIISSLSTITCLITWMVWWELWPRRRHNERKTYSLPWSLRGRSCPNIKLKWFQRLVCLSCRQISLILSGNCDH
jgi:hypothetical protein